MVQAAPATWYRWEQGDLLLTLRVSPRASADAIEEPLGDQLRVRLTAPPVEGKANAHLCRFLAKLFGVPPSRVAVVSGELARIKRVRILKPARLPEFIPPPEGLSPLSKAPPRQ